MQIDRATHGLARVLHETRRLHIKEALIGNFPFSSPWWTAEDAALNE
jgi:hypothetical protein